MKPINESMHVVAPFHGYLSFFARLVRLPRLRAANAPFFGSLRSGSRTGSKVEGGPKRANASFRTTLFPVFEHH